MSNFVPGSVTLKYDDVISVILSVGTCRKPQVDLHQEFLWTHKVEVEWMREEITLEIVGNQK